MKWKAEEFRPETLEYQSLRRPILVAVCDKPQTSDRGLLASLIWPATIFERRRFDTLTSKAPLFMLRSELIHPQISQILARAGHSSKVLIADGNYPASSAIGPKAELISLNLAPGLVTVAQVLRVLLTAIPIEAVNTMGMPDDDPYLLPHDPPVWNEYRSILSAAGQPIALEPISRWAFYDAVDSRDHVLTIQTGDQALWANLLLTVGVRMSGT